jgi:hypothetical protein
MDQVAFKLLVDRLERIEAQNDHIAQQNVDQLTLLHKHILDDNETRAIVDEHSRYFRWSAKGLGALLTAMLAKLGLT